MFKRPVVMIGNLTLLATLIALLYILLFWPGDVSANRTEKRIVFGATYMTMNNPYYQTLDTQLRAKIEERGDVLLTRDAAMDQKRQNEEIRELIDAGVQAIFMASVEWDTSEEGLR
ncbi:MAG: sugar ABC transporter substrate-binding protein, partial [Oscillospiraceae bacterium]|nr:sugar ABC transporter substrate-binding protein [Oscillospiraceae bacterium]